MYATCVTLTIIGINFPILSMGILNHARMLWHLYIFPELKLFPVVKHIANINEIPIERDFYIILL